MSIWASIGADHDGEQVNGYGVNYAAEGEPTGWMDVATGTPWNGCVRLVIQEPAENEGREAMVMLDRENAQRLARHLQEAVDYIDKREAAYLAPPL